MPSSTLALRLPSSPSFHFPLKYLKPTLSLPSPSWKLVFVGYSNFVLGRNRILGPYRMTELTETSVYRYSVGDEGARMIQPESSSSSFGSSRFELLRGQLESIINKLSKWLVAGLFCLVLLLRHDAEALWAVMGSVINSAISIVLKRILNQERPLATLRSDPGMPSSHAQSISFIAVFVILSIVEWLGMNALSLTLSGVTFLLAIYLTWLRVSQQLHTINQVVVGAILGSVFSVLWFWWWKAIVSKAFISYLWVRIVVFLVASVFCLGFTVYVIKNWFRSDR